MRRFFPRSLAVHTHQIPTTRVTEIGSARGFATGTSNLLQWGQGSWLRLSLAEGCTLQGASPKYLHTGLISPRSLIFVSGGNRKRVEPYLKHGLALLVAAQWADTRLSTVGCLQADAKYGLAKTM